MGHMYPGDYTTQSGVRRGSTHVPRHGQVWGRGSTHVPQGYTTWSGVGEGQYTCTPGLYDMVSDMVSLEGKDDCVVGYTQLGTHPQQHKL